MGSYIGAILASFLIKVEEANVAINVFLYGGIAWIAGILVGLFGVFNIIELGILPAFIIFGIIGIISYAGFSELGKSGD